ncbi:MAG TPA: MaoC family dehydratase [Gammaproteobacteria bacterium]|nr:MaoC family dehydratase [Gammaproteobacteria bacterium]
MLYLDDLAAGQKFRTGSAAVTAEAIKAFAAEFDPQPFHLDENEARTSLFGRLAASGWHTGALSMRLLVQGEMRIAGGLIGLGGEVSWPRPTYAGDTLHLESEVLDVRVSNSKPDRGIVTVRNRTLNQHGEVVQLAVIKMLVPRAPAQAPDTAAGSAPS